MQKRRRFKHPDSLIERLNARADELRDLADGLPPGEKRTLLIKNAEQCDQAAAMDGWLRSKELEPPR